MIIPQNYKGENKRERVEAMFDSIAPRYDLLNRILSAGTDKGWRKKTIHELSELSPATILDIATGTGDLAIEALKKFPGANITGVDISMKMLEVGREKIRKKNLQDHIKLIQADSENLPFKDESFDAVTVAFGVRNFEHLTQGLKEIYRVLQKDGKAVILEFSQPHQFPIKQLYTFYSKYILPVAGEIISRQRSAYEYLPASVAEFPSGKDFISELKKAGFNTAEWKPLTFGIASIYIAGKQDAENSTTSGRPKR